jgi:hypothetical protein
MGLPKQRRKRGVILTSQGLQKLEIGKSAWEATCNRGLPYTFEELSYHTGLDSRTIARIISSKVGVDKRSLEEFFKALNLELEERDYTQPIPSAPVKDATVRQFWRTLEDGTSFYGYAEEVEQLQQWFSPDLTLNQQSSAQRLVLLFGMGGIGKTTIALKLTQQIASSFKCVIWKSLWGSPPLSTLLVELARSLSEQDELLLPSNPDNLMADLLHHLRLHRCLIVLDNLESLFCDDYYAGHYRQGYENYAELFTQIAQIHHQSCLLLISREQPKHIRQLETITPFVKGLHLQGIQPAAGQALSQARKMISGTSLEWQTLIEHYAGNPQALQIITPLIEDYFHGNLSEFVRYLKQGQLLFDDIRELINQHLVRLTPLEQQIVHILSTQVATQVVTPANDLSLVELEKAIAPPVLMGELLEALDSLCRRCLVEKRGTQFCVHPVTAEYVLERSLLKPAIDESWSRASHHNRLEAHVNRLLIQQRSHSSCFPKAELF